MPTKTTAKGALAKRDYKALVDEIREVVKDAERQLSVRNTVDGGRDRLDEDLGFFIIRDLLNGTEDDLTKDYRATKAANAMRAAKRSRAPAPS